MATGGDLGTAWRAEAYDDSAWPSGPGILGFKNSPLATTIPATSGRTTYYFRTKVDVADASTISSATLNAVIDDGAVVYVNGTEAARSNLAAGAVSFTQKALVDVTGAAENTPDRPDAAHQPLPHRHQHHRGRGAQQGQRPR